MTLSRWIRPLALPALALAALGAGIGVGGWKNLCRDCPSAAQVYAFEPKRATLVMSHDGRIIAELAEERRTPVELATLPAYVPQAFIAIEDQRFYRHSGYSVRGIARAAVMRVPGFSQLFGRRTGGGSTITQQLARHMFEREIGFERHGLAGPARKIKELQVALELEKVYTKDRILEAYINQVNYGRGHLGIASASRWMFGKPAYEVNPAEAALLAAVINRPESYSPFKQPERALARRNHVLNEMREQGYLDEAEAARWKSEPLPVEPQNSEQSQLAPYFVEYVRDILDDRFGDELYRSGFRVYTTLDVEMQRAAHAAMQAGWKRIEGARAYRHDPYDPTAAPPGRETPYLQGMFIAAEPQTGAIRALIGGRDFRHSKFNRAVQSKRQPGSVFKPFVYTAALASGIPASYVVEDSPVFIDLVDGTTWSPRNFDRDFKGPMTLRHALKLSINTVTVKLGQQVGMETVVQYAQRMGLRNEIPPYPATAIGAAEVIPIEVVEAYSAFATGGVRARPFGILRVEDANGRLLWQARPDTARVLDPLLGALMRDLLRDVVDHGSGYPVRDPSVGALPYDIPAAGKTGTTNDEADIWFVGFTPDLVAAVWFGFDTRRSVLPRAAGGVYAAPVWAEFMRNVYLGEPPLRPRPAPWTLPEGITGVAVDRQSGRRAVEGCPEERVYTEFFLPGTEPQQVCDAPVRVLGVPISR